MRLVAPGTPFQPCASLHAVRQLTCWQHTSSIPQQVAASLRLYVLPIQGLQRELRPHRHVAGRSVHSLLGVPHRWLSTESSMNCTQAYHSQRLLCCDMTKRRQAVLTRRIDCTSSVFCFSSRLISRASVSFASSTPGMRTKSLPVLLICPSRPLVEGLLCRHSTMLSNSRVGSALLAPPCTIAVACKPLSHKRG